MIRAHIRKTAIILCCLVAFGTGIRDSHAQSGDAPAAAPSAASTQDITIESSLQSDFARIMFRRKNITNFTASLQDNLLTVTFGSTISPDLTPLTDALKPHVTEAHLSDDKKSLLVTLQGKNLRMRKFIGDDLAGVDVLNIGPGVPDPIHSVVGPHPPTPKKKQAAPPAGEKEPSAQKQADASPDTPGKAPAALSGIRSFTMKGTLDIGRERIDNGIRLIFPWQTEVGTAIFNRGQYVWIVFDSPYRLNVGEIKGIKYIENVKQIFHTHYSILLVKIHDDYHVTKDGPRESLINLHAFKNDFSWVLDIQESDPESNEDTSVANAARVLIQASLSTPRVFLAVLRTAEPLKMIDPIVGDTLIIVPLYNEENGVAPGRNFVDFTLFETAQGVAFQKITDSLEYKLLRNGISITNSRGLNITTSQESAETESDIDMELLRRKRAKKAVLPSETVFPFKEAETEEETHRKSYAREDYVDKRQVIVAAINDVPEHERSAKRLELAKFYFGEELYSDALGVIEEIQALDPLFEAMQEAELMLAAAKFLEAHYLETEELFRVLAEEAEGHESHEELKFWRWASYRMLTEDQQRKREAVAIDYIASFDRFLRHYPADLKFKFGLLAANEKVLEQDYTKAKSILEIITYNGVPERYKNDTRFLEAQISYQEGETEAALEKWKDIASDVLDRKNRARSLFELTKHKLIQGEIGIEEAVKTFDKLSILWRGDQFEVDLLKLIGQLYIKDKRYAEGLEAWRVLVSNFPNTQDALFIAGKMKRTFIRLFEKGEAYDLPPVEALALYFEFRELTPVGPKGDNIIQQLANHFIAADLLENAAALIAHQVRYRTTGEKKYELALKLANIYLENKKPGQAIGALDFLEDNASDEQKLRAKYIKITALIRQGKFAEATDTLHGDFSKKAQDLRLDIFWLRKNWFGIIRIIEARLDDMRATAPFLLTAEQTNDLLRLSVAYAMQEKRRILRDLQNEFMSRIEKKNMENIFWFVTNDMKAVDYREFEKTVQLGEMESFLNDYAFWPGKDWANVMYVLAPRVEKMKREEPPLSLAEKRDIIRLAIAYAMQPDNPEASRGLNGLQRDFRDIVVDRDTLDLLAIFDDQFVPLEEDTIFEGRVQLRQIPELIEKYQAAHSISELNAAIGS